MSSPVQVHQVNQPAPIMSGPSASWKKALFAVPLAGMLYAFIMLKSQLYLPQVLRDQFLTWVDPKHTDWTLLVFSLAAIASGSLVYMIISMISPTLFNKVRAPMFTTNTGRFASFLGSLFVGSGVALAGNSPGSLMTQLAVGCTSYHPFVGYLAGNMLAQVSKPFLRFLTSFRSEKQRANPFMDKQLKMNASVFLLLNAALFSSLAIAASYFLLKWNLYSGYHTFSLHSMIHHPFLSGLAYGLINLLLVPSVLTGISLHIPYTVTGQYILSMIPKLPVGITTPQFSVNNHWQFLFLASVFGSSFLAKKFTPVAESCDIGSFRNDFIGALLAGFGSEFAAGDSGHMLTQMSKGANYETVLGVALGGTLTSVFAM
ncbi:hypothetical protein GEMRC1_009427 [Eukaryota sp. GEM-RC1]